MKIHLWGTDFRRSNAETRAKLCLPAEARETALKELLALGFDDLVYLSTCNRVEFYTTARDHFCDTRPTWLKLLAFFGLPEDTFYQGYQLEGKSAVRHLMRVASSLESMVVGEPRILGQLKDALRWSQGTQAVSRSLERSFNLAFETAKRVRTETAIGEKPVSVATLGLQKVQALEAELPLRRAVLVGRSPMNSLLAQWLKKNRPQVPLLWVNRNVQALDSVPEAVSAPRLALADFLASPPPFSHLFTATASLEPIFSRGFLSALTDLPKLVLDLAQPADVERGSDRPGCIRVIHLEDLTQEAKGNAVARAQATQAAEVIIEETLKEYCLEQKEAPVLRDFSSIEPSFLEELNQALATLEKELPAEMQARVKKWAEKLVKKNLHLSREHLRLVLRQVSKPDDEISPFTFL